MIFLVVVVVGIIFFAVGIEMYSIIESTAHSRIPIGAKVIICILAFASLVVFITAVLCKW